MNMRRQVIALARNAWEGRELCGKSYTYVWDYAHKRAATKLEAQGIVQIVRTGQKFGGVEEWHVTLTPKGVEFVAALTELEGQAL